MTEFSDRDFLEELARRLNVLLSRDVDRMNGALSIPMASSGYANLGHFLGSLGLAPRLTSPFQPKEVHDLNFLVPIIEERKIVRFEVLTGRELEHRAEKEDTPSRQGTPPRRV